ncbi:zinc finger CCCH domain-containing protein 41 [Tanacetum coccineum]
MISRCLQIDDDLQTKVAGAIIGSGLKKHFEDGVVKREENLQPLRKWRLRDTHTREIREERIGKNKRYVSVCKPGFKLFASVMMSIEHGVILMESIKTAYLICGGFRQMINVCLDTCSGWVGNRRRPSQQPTLPNNEWISQQQFSGQTTEHQFFGNVGDDHLNYEYFSGKGELETFKREDDSFLCAIMPNNGSTQIRTTLGDKELMELGVDKKNVDRQLRGEHCKVLNLINENGFAYSKYRSHKVMMMLCTVMGLVRQWCMDFEKQGFCLRGDMCPMEHGLNRIVVKNVPASYITGGVYLRPQHLDGLFQYLTISVLCVSATKKQLSWDTFALFVCLYTVSITRNEAHNQF